MKTVKSRAAHLIGTWFGCGCVPVAPGTAGSLAALAIAWALAEHFHLRPPAAALLGLAFLPPGIWASSEVALSSGSNDPSIVVIDEVVGQWITMAGITTSNWKSWLGAFVLFRLFDIWKPPPVRQTERLEGGVGIMADDVVAGLYGASVLYVAGRLHLY